MRNNRYPIYNNQSKFVHNEAPKSPKITAKPNTSKPPQKPPKELNPPQKNGGIFDIIKSLFDKIDKEDFLLFALILVLFQEEDKDIPLILALGYLLICDKININDILGLIKL